MKSLEVRPRKLLVLVAGAALMMGAAASSIAGASATQSAAAIQPPIDASEIALVHSIIGEMITRPTSVDVIRVLGADAVQAWTPGERPWGFATDEIAAHNVLVVRIPQNLIQDSHPRRAGTPSMAAVEALVMVDMETKSVISSTMLEAEPAELSRQGNPNPPQLFDFATRLGSKAKTAPRSVVEVTPTRP